MTRRLLYALALVALSFAPWRTIVWTRARFGLCWAKCVGLKLYGWRDTFHETEHLYPDPICFASHPNPMDYCGLYPADHLERARSRLRLWPVLAIALAAALAYTLGPLLATEPAAFLWDGK